MPSAVSRSLSGSFSTRNVLGTMNPMSDFGKQLKPARTELFGRNSGVLACPCKLWEVMGAVHTPQASAVREIGSRRVIGAQTESIRWLVRRGGVVAVGLVWPCSRWQDSAVLLSVPDLFLSAVCRETDWIRSLSSAPTTCSLTLAFSMLIPAWRRSGSIR